MRILASNLVVAFWSFIFGEIIGYIGGALEVVTWHPLSTGIISVIAAVIAVNGFMIFSNLSMKASK